MRVTSSKQLNMLKPSRRQMTNATTEGNLNSKMPEVSKELIKDMIMNNYYWNSTLTKPRKIPKLYDVDVTSIAVQVVVLNKKINGLSVFITSFNNALWCLCQECQIVWYGAYWLLGKCTSLKKNPIVTPTTRAKGIIWISLELIRYNIDQIFHLDFNNHLRRRSQVWKI